MALERVQKILAQTGIASRRKAEELITEGSVTVNGKVAKLGDKADLATDAIKVNGKLLRGREPETYLAFFKPKAVISMMTDPEGRPTIADYTKRVTTRVFPIGRLDFMSEGLILLTNDGEFAEKLQRRDDIPRVYHVKVKGHPNEEMLERLRRGARFGNRLVQPQSVRLSDEYSNKARIEIVIVGSGAVDLQAFVESRGFLVERITRAAIGHLTVKGLVPGAMRVLEKSQVEALLNQPELGTRMIERSSTKRARFQATSEEDREKMRARARGVKPRLTKIREKQDDYREKIGAPRKNTRVEDESDAPRERSARPSRGAPSRSTEGRPERIGFGARRSTPGSEPSERRGPKTGGKGFAKDRSETRAPRTSRSEGGYGVFRERDGGEDSPRGRKPLGRTSERSETRSPSRGAGRSFGRKSEGGEKSSAFKVKFGRGERSERPARSFGGERSERPARSFGGERSERPARSFGGERSARGGAGRPSSRGGRPAGGGGRSGGAGRPRGPRRER